MSNSTASADTFASGRYSKRKRTQVTYHLDDLDYSDTETDLESPQTKKPKAKTVSKPLPKHKIFPFMKLSAEIRNMIYDYALRDPAGINFAGAFKHGRRTVSRISAECRSKVSAGRVSFGLYMSKQLRNEFEEPVPLVPSLLAVNQQIYQEGIDVLYGNDFIFTDSFALYAFMINIGPWAAKHIKSMRILGWHRSRAMKTYNHACFAALACATNLTALHIDASIGSYCASQYGAHQLYRDAFPWLEAVGTAKGKPDAALDILLFSDSCFPDRRHPYGATSPTGSRDQRIKAFRTVLSNLLGARQKRIMVKPVKTKKKMKVTKAVVVE